MENSDGSERTKRATAWLPENRVEGGIQNLCRRLGASGEPERVAEGTFNDVFRFPTHGAQGQRILRVRMPRGRFGYERNLLKEPIVAALLARTPSSSMKWSGLDVPRRKLDASVLEFGVGPPVYAYDMDGGDDVPGPWIVMGYVAEAPLSAKSSEALYFELGRKLARLHTVTLDGFYSNFNAAGGEGRTAASHFAERIKSMEEACAGLPGEVELRQAARALQRLTEDSDFLEGARPAVVHNDIHPGNVLGSEAAVTIIDWDNTVIECPELDLVKLKHWTRMGLDGRFTRDEALHQEFLRGYRDAKGEINPVRLRFYELLWLMRIVAFEWKRAQEQGTVPMPFPDCSYYLGPLRELSSSEKERT